MAIFESPIVCTKSPFLNGKGTSKATGFSFCALGIANGEDLHPDWVIDIKSISVNGKEVKEGKRKHGRKSNLQTRRCRSHP